MVKKKGRDPKELAILASQKSTHKKIKSGAVIISRKGAVIGIGASHPHINFPILGRFKHTSAEIDALNSVYFEKRLPFSTVYIFAQRVNNENIVSGKPSKKCERILREAGVSRIIYSTEDGWEEISLLQKNENRNGGEQ